MSVRIWKGKSNKNSPFERSPGHKCRRHSLLRNCFPTLMLSRHPAVFVSFHIPTSFISKISHFLSHRKWEGHSFLSGYTNFTTSHITNSFLWKKEWKAFDRRKSSKISFCLPFWPDRQWLWLPDLGRRSRYHEGYPLFWRYNNSLLPHSLKPRLEYW